MNERNIKREGNKKLIKRKEREQGNNRARKKRMER